MKPYICVNILNWCVSFGLTSLFIIGSSFIHLIRTDSNVFFLKFRFKIPLASVVCYLVGKASPEACAFILLVGDLTGFRHD